MSKLNIRDVEVDGKLAEILKAFPRGFKKRVLKGLAEMALETEEGLIFLKSMAYISMNKKSVDAIIEQLEKPARKRRRKPLSDAFAIEDETQ